MCPWDLWKTDFGAIFYRECQVAECAPNNAPIFLFLCPFVLQVVWDARDANVTTTTACEGHPSLSSINFSELFYENKRT